MIRLWEHDDFPRYRDHTLSVFDGIRAKYPKFRVTVFGIPGEMTEQDFAEIDKRRDWMHLGVHGFYHDKSECREPTTWRQYLRWLTELASDPRWTKMFKAPWHGIDSNLCVELAARGFAVSIKTIPFFPYPMPMGIKCFCLHDQWYASGGLDNQFIETHPCYEEDRFFKANETNISPRHVRKMMTGWKAEDAFEFPENLTRELCLKVNLDRDGELLAHRLPYGNCKADAVMAGHSLSRLPVETWPHLFEDVFRVLRPGAVFRLVLNGQSKSTAVSMLKSVGFVVMEQRNGETISPHKDLSSFNPFAKKRRRNHAFVLEAIKACSVVDVTRASHKRPSKPRDLRHLYEVAR